MCWVVGFAVLGVFEGKTLYGFLYFFYRKFTVFCRIGVVVMVVWYVSDGYGGRRTGLFGSEQLLRQRLEEWRTDDFDEYGNYLYEDDIVCETVITD